MKKIMVIILCMILALPLFGCELKREKSWREKVDSIKEGMTLSELIELMGEPDADLGSGAVIYMYILPEEHVLVVSIQTDYSRDVPTEIVGKTPVVETYDEFKERFRYYPDDPNAWWNAE